MKNYIVSTPNENHYFTNKNEAIEDFNWGISEMEKLKIQGEIAIYECPENDMSFELEMYEHFEKCLTNGTAIKIQSQEVK